jgi:hypothetical protein
MFFRESGPDNSKHVVKPCLRPGPLAGHALGRRGAVPRPLRRREGDRRAGDRGEVPEHQVIDRLRSRTSPCVFTINGTGYGTNSGRPQPRDGLDLVRGDPRGSVALSVTSMNKQWTISDVTDQQWHLRLGRVAALHHRVSTLHRIR